MSVPKTSDDWEVIVQQTENRWQFPNAIAAADGKHIGITCPPHAGSMYYTYKGFHSVVLLAFVDFNYKFLIAEVGCQGRISDGGVYRNSQMYEALENMRRKTPIFLYHGKSDDVLPYKAAEKTYDFLKQEIYDGVSADTFKYFAENNLGHSLSPKELRDVSQFMNL